MGRTSNEAAPIPDDLDRDTWRQAALALERQRDEARAELARAVESKAQLKASYKAVLQRTREDRDYHAQRRDEVHAELTRLRALVEAPTCVDRLRMLSEDTEEYDGGLSTDDAWEAAKLDCINWLLAAPLAALATAEPIDMVLRCPACTLQHIDAPSEGWDNPPHRSHLCDGCGFIWRPADVATNGVAAVKTRGKGDSAPTAPDSEKS